MKAVIILVVAAWLALAVGGVLGIAFGYPPAGSFVATRDLKFGHKIVAGDVRAAPLLAFQRTLRPRLSRLITSRDFVGRYITHHGTITAPRAVEFDATAERPTFDRANAGSGLVLAWIQLPDAKPGFAGMLDSGDVIDVCGDAANSCASDLRLVAVACGADGPPCTAAVWVTTAQRTALTAAKSKAVSVFVHP